MRGGSQICQHHDTGGMDALFSEPTAPKHSQASRLQNFEEDVKILGVFFNVATRCNV